MSLSFRYWFWISAGCFILILSSSLLPPKDWNLTHLLFSYDYGFQRRGLFGEILSHFLPDEVRKSHLYIASFFLSLASDVAVFAFLARKYSRVEGGGPLLLLFTTSIGFVGFVGNTGHLDNLLLLGALLALVLPISLAGHLLRVVVIVAMLLVHENMLPYFVVLIAFDVWMAQSDRHWQARLVTPAVIMSVSILATALIFRYGSFEYEDVWWIQFQLELKSVDFDIRNIAFEPITHYPDGVATPFQWVWSSPYYVFRLIFFGGVGLVFVLLHLGRVMRAMPRSSVLDRLGVILAVIAPLSLLTIAFDVSRFLSIAMVDLFLVIAILISRAPDVAARLNGAFSLGFTVAMLAFNGQVALRQYNAAWAPAAGAFPGGFMLQTGWFVEPYSESD